MKHLLIIAILCLFQGTLSGQKWEHTYGFPNTDEHVMGMIETYDGGYLLDGHYNDNEYNWLIKTDINGNLLWDKQIVWQDGYLLWGRLKEDSQKNIVIICMFAKPGIGTWPMVIKLNQCAELLWCRIMADYNYSYGNQHDLLILENDDILLLTDLESQQHIDQCFIYYFDKDGNYHWRKSIASSINYPLIDFRLCERIQQYGNNYLINGYVYSAYSTNPNHYYLRPFFVMLDSAFNEKWVLPFGVADSIYGKAYNTLQIGEKIFMGAGTRRFFDGEAYVNNSLLMFMDTDGQELGYTQISNETVGTDIGSNFISDIERVNDSIFLATSNYGPDEQGNPFGEFVLDTAGTIYKKNSRPSTFGITELIKTFDQKYTVATNISMGISDSDILFYKINENLEDDSIYTFQYIYDSLCPNIIASGIIDVTSSAIITDVGEIPVNQELESGNVLSVYPNPVQDEIIHLVYHNKGKYDKVEIRCYNLFGVEVYREKIYSLQSESLLSVSDWGKGMYLVVVYENGKSVGKAKFVVQ